MKTFFIPMLLLCAVLSLLHAQVKIDTVGAHEAAGWREGVFTNIPAAFDIAKKQGGGMLICFSGDPLLDKSLAAQVYGEKKIREWASKKNLTLALIEFPRPGTPDVQEARTHFYELTRQFKI